MKNTAENLHQKLNLVRKLNRGLWGSPNEPVHFKEAEDILSSLLLSFPANTLVLTNMGALLCDQGKYKEALTYLKKQNI